MTHLELSRIDVEAVRSVRGSGVRNLDPERSSDLFQRNRTSGNVSTTGVETKASRSRPGCAVSAPRSDIDGGADRSEQYFRVLAENTTDVVMWCDLTTTRRYVSPSAKAVLGHEATDLIGTRPLDFVHPDDIEAYRQVLDDLTQGRTERAVTTQRYRHGEGRWVWLEVSLKLTHDPGSGVATGYVASLRDVTDRKAAEDALRLSEERLALALDSCSDGLWDWHLPTGEIQFSHQLFAMLDYEPEELGAQIGVWDTLVHPADAARARRLLANHLKGLTRSYECEYRLRKKGGAYAWILARGKVVGHDDRGRARRIVGTHVDITRRKAAELQIAHMATHDALTGLANRTLFWSRLRAEIAWARKTDRRIAVLACDLDRFKAVNDSLGHPAGDTLLRVVSERLRGVIRDSDMVARLGGDEFALILAPLQSSDEAYVTARRIIESVRQQLTLSGHSASVGISIGIAFGAVEDEDADQLFKHADIALYRAKAAGRNTFRCYEPGMDGAVVTRNLLELDLRQAVHRGDFVLNYQPIVSVATGATRGFEALLRWEHPQRGTISPAEFIPLAEETGVIVPLGDWVLREACRVAAGWPEEITIAVNVSAVQFAQPGLEESVIGALAASGLSPRRLELEITESVLVGDAESVISCLHRLRGMGIRIALDDFGTGYSSLSYLRRFPFDKIKIDQSFVREIVDSNTAAIVRAIVGLGERLGATITAEGVETDEQLEHVRKEGCTEVQGYRFGKPQPAEQASNFATRR